jgi:serine acetyltransferase
LRGRDFHRGVVVPEEKTRRMKRALTIRNVAKGAGALVLGLIALDLVASVATLAVGWGMLKK